MTILRPPCAPFLDMFGLNERMKDSQGQVRRQGNALELLEVAMWVALTQHQTGRKFLFEHILHMRRHGIRRWSLS